MPDDKRIPPHRSWIDRSFNSTDIQHVIGYIQTQASGFFGGGRELSVTMVSIDPHNLVLDMKADFPVDPNMFNAFVARMQRIFDRKAGGYSAEAPAGIRYVTPIWPGTPQPHNSFQISGNPRQLLEQIIANATDQNQFAKDFPWNQIGKTR